MAHTRKWIKNTPWNRGISYIHDRSNRFYSLSQDEMLFGLLTWIGLTKTHAYQVAFPNTDVKGISIPTLASRLYNSWEMSRFIDFLARKEQYMQYRYTKRIEDDKHGF